ncbi:uncharacterized protein LOC133287967 [Gastrolobium bilobum]|uniref:uncharacterized protein LOC133287967 n=1 Tax=Gastrolobium bilobum TaxID=150636 RepID=UPI002AB0682C|nr:uncharacterized protein LOC133287967 [Gastrolobium bilobum]
MRRKTLGGRRRTPSTTPPSLSAIPFLSTPQDELNATVVFDSESDDDHPHVRIPDCIDHHSEPVDLLDENICICCNKSERALVCSENGCPVTVHANCIGSEPKFDDSGKFFCPYCWFKRAVNKSRELREKAMVAKKALSTFLDKGQLAKKDGNFNKEEEEDVKVMNRAKPETEVKESFEFEERVNDSEDVGERIVVENKGEVSATGSSVSETKDSDSEAVSMKKLKVRNKVVASSIRKPLLRERNIRGRNAGDVNEQVTSSSKSLRSPKQVAKRTSLTAKRKRLLWATEEEKALKEGVLRFSTENQNIPWRKILEFGSHVFDKTRTPSDLKDKWKNITSREGCK